MAESYEKNDRDADAVIILIGLGVSVAHISKALGISVSTLKKRYRKEIEIARTQMRLAACTGLMNVMKRGNLRATRMMLEHFDPSWRDSSTVPVTRGERAAKLLGMALDIVESALKGGEPLGDPELALRVLGVEQLWKAAS